MNSGKPKKISEASYQELLRKAEKNGFKGEFLKESHQWQIASADSWLVRINLPWDSNPDKWGQLIKKDDHHLALVMIRAGIASTGYFHNGILLDHKVFRAYMVRQKQGKSQIKYLKTKGKSRAGSRVRLGETTEFFNEISNRLASYDHDFPIDTWGISCAKTLLPFFFESKPSPPFSKKQENLFSIPFHISHPGLETLEQTHVKLNQLQITCSEAGIGFYESLQIENRDSSASAEDDW